MSRLAPMALALALMLAFPAPILARAARPTRSTSGMDRRDLALVIKALEDDPDLIDEMLATDPQFKTLADEFVPASKSRLAGGRALVAIGAISMLLGALVGGSLWVVQSDPRIAAKATLGATIGGGFALLVPGICLMATSSGAEKSMRTYWQDNRAAFLRPEALTGPRLRLASDRSLPRTPLVNLLSLPF